MCVFGKNDQYVMSLIFSCVEKEKMKLPRTGTQSFRISVATE